MFNPNNLVDSKIQARREWIFLLLAGLFIGSMVLLNVLGISRFIDLSSWVGIADDSPIRFSLAIGVLAYPVTFLCTDFISEIYGRKRANQVVWVGLILNFWVLLILWLGGQLNPPDNLQNGLLPLELVNGQPSAPHGYSFYQMRYYTFAATISSMLAYILAQFCDVHIFHYLKQKTKGKKRWLRNNVSTLTSQLVDSIAVILITYYFTNGLPLKEGIAVETQLLYFILSSYIFKMICALLDTIPFYIGTTYLRKYLEVEDEIA
jgi:queuosine precursor transporter